MTFEALLEAQQSAYREPWPPDDTEESVLGSDLHQTTIRCLATGINEAAHLLCREDEPLPFKALSQTLIFGCERPDETPLRTYPDVFVYEQIIDPRRGSVSIALDGPPLLVIEVLSESTYASDVDLKTGKGFSYARAGVKEYLVLDPAGEWIPDHGRGWRLGRDAYDGAWTADEGGIWKSTNLPLAFSFEGVMATVYTADGSRIPREGETSEIIRQQAAEIEDLRRQLRQK